MPEKERPINNLSKIFYISQFITEVMDEAIIFSILVMTVMFTLYIQFIVRTNRVKRNLPFFPTTLFIVLIVSILTALGSISIHNFPQYTARLLTLQQIVSGLGIVLFFLFQENLIQYNRNHLRFGFVCSLVTLHTVFQIVILFYIEENLALIVPYFDILWLFSTVPFYSMGIYVFGIFGLPIWWKTYRKTRAKIFITFIIADIVLTMGEILLLIGGIFAKLIPSISPFIITIELYGNLFAYCGLFLIFALIALNYLSLYRFPQENYGLIISDRSGIALYFVRFRSKTGIQLQEDLLAGFLSAIHNVFHESLQSSKLVKFISSGDAEILMEHGQYISIAFAAQSVSGLIAGELANLVKEFEERFEMILKTNNYAMDQFNNTAELIRKHFPYLDLDT
jgi:hypothetical protein